LYIKPSNVLRWGTWVILGALFAWLALRFLLPCAAPFIAAFILARTLEPMVKFLCRQGWKREFASGVCSLAFLSFLVILTGALLSRGIRELAQLEKALPEMLSSLSQLLDGARSRAGQYRSLAPPELTGWLDSAVAAMTETFARLPAMVSQKLLSFLSAAASRMPGIMLFTATVGIGIYFISAAYPAIQTWLDTHLPQPWQKRRLIIGHSMRYTLGRYLRAQGILMLITFFELFIGLLLLGAEGAFIISAVTAFLDALPVLGAGIVLLPWAIITFLTGSTAQGVGLIILWGITALVRSCIQAKLLGDQMGLPPLITLMAIYAGWCLAGVWGMVLFPMLALMAKQLEVGTRIRRFTNGS